MSEAAPDTGGKVQLAMQIAEVKREIALRAAVYPGLVQSKKLTEDQAAIATQRMKSVLRTLEWVAANEDEFRNFAAARRHEGGPNAPRNAASNGASGAGQNRFTTASMLEELDLALALYAQRSTAIPDYRVERLKAVRRAFEERLR